jgi:hypothetical protein
MDDDGSALAFDASSRDSMGEMELIEITNYRELTRHRSLSAYWLAYANRREEWLQEHGEQDD